jgi:hypothetical protein
VVSAITMRHLMDPALETKAVPALASLLTLRPAADRSV